MRGQQPAPLAVALSPTDPLQRSVATGAPKLRPLRDTPWCYDCSSQNGAATQ